MKLERGKGGMRDFDSPASALQGLSLSATGSLHVPSLRDNWIHNQNNGVVAIHLPLSMSTTGATATHHRLTYKGTCHPTAQAPASGTQGDQGLVHSTAFFKRFQSWKGPGRSRDPGVSQPQCASVSAGGDAKTQPHSAELQARVSLN